MRTDNDLHREASRSDVENRRNADKLAQWKDRSGIEHKLDEKIQLELAEYDRRQKERIDILPNLPMWIAAVVFSWLAVIGLYTVFSWLSEWMS